MLIGSIILYVNLFVAFATTGGAFPACLACSHLNAQRHHLSPFFNPGNELPPGVDKSLLDLMRPLHDKGLRSEALSDTILELHSKSYHQKYIKREREILASGGLIKKLMMSTFCDKKR